MAWGFTLFGGTELALRNGRGRRRGGKAEQFISFRLHAFQPITLILWPHVLVGMQNSLRCFDYGAAAFQMALD